MLKYRLLTISIVSSLAMQAQVDINGPVTDYDKKETLALVNICIRG